MRVTEIFFSIQGEGSRAGRPCTFVRFTGCDLRCGYCDTPYAFHGGEDLSLEEILEAVARHPTRFVLLTGGEPMLQKELPALEPVSAPRPSGAEEPPAPTPLNVVAAQ